ncbi:MAG: glycoside hydrolase family 127 protein [Phycisphaeraceae bacterium]|nr:MAG: glycoside hydrolase family 127 protein [Phycisphaeraceae bacterium]
MPTLSHTLACLAAVIAASTAFTTPPQPSDAPRVVLQPVRWTDARLAGPYWTPMMEAVRLGTLQANLDQCESTGRLANFRRAAGIEQGDYQGLLFNDSDVYKAIEGAAYLLALHPDPALDARLDALIAVIAKAQRPDGYINTYYTLKAGLDTRWTNEQHDHESYCIGHLIEAGIAHHQATGKLTLLDVAVKAADHVCSVFGKGRLEDAPGHQEIELALVRLYHLTKQQRYLDTARFLIETRGRPRANRTPPLFGEYCQDHVPAMDLRKAAGHSVRLAYQAIAMADLALLGDAQYLPALEALWRDVTSTQMFVTGGIGASAHNEGFTRPFDLPTESAYQETCASIALAMWSHRMFLLTGYARYMDAFERALYNGIASGLAADGRSFFYVNPLASRGAHARSPWFACACCPPNVLRFYAALGQYAYATRGNDIYINLYAEGDATIQTPKGPVTIRQRTRYPADGRVDIELIAPADAAGHLYLRIPAWARDAAPDRRPDGSGTMSFSFNNWWTETPTERDGYAKATYAGPDTQAYTIHFPLAPRRAIASPRAESLKGHAAVTLGPVVYCLEAQAGPDREAYHEFILPPGTILSTEPNPLVGLGMPAIKAHGLRAPILAWDDDELYRSPSKITPFSTALIPYAAWANRGPAAMKVWIPESPSVRGLGPRPGLKASASHVHAGDSLAALSDRVEPSSSRDASIPRFTWWDRRGGPGAQPQWVRYDFDQPRVVASTSVYWYDDRGGCKTPESWTLEYLDESDEWKTVKPPAGDAGVMGVFPVEHDRFNEVRFEPVRARAVRINAVLRGGASAGILEWRVGE